MQYSFKNISNELLLEKTKTLVAEERKITTEVLWCLREVDDRLLYAELGYSSLYEFATQELGYSEGSKVTYADLIDKMADLMIQKLEKEKGILNRPAETHLSGEVTAIKPIKSQKIAAEKGKSFGVSNEIPWPASRLIPVATRRQVWLRDQARCTYQNPQTGKTCYSQFGLEIDHIRPYAFGGSHELENLRLRCRAHNQLHARKNAG